MKFFCDENVDQQIVQRLRRDGHDVTTVLEMDAGVSDEVVLARATENGAVLVTADKDFGELALRLRRHTAGILLLRLHGVPPDQKADLVGQHVRHLKSQLLGAFVVLTPTTVRLRRSFR